MSLVMLVMALIQLCFVAPEILNTLFRMQSKHQDLVGTFVYQAVTIEYWVFALFPVVVLTTFGLIGLYKFKRSNTFPRV